MKKVISICGGTVCFETVDGGWVLVPRSEVDVKLARRDMYGRLCYLVEAEDLGVAGLLWYDYTDLVSDFVRSYDFRVVSDTTFNKRRRVYNLDRLGRCDGLK